MIPPKPFAEGPATCELQRMYDLLEPFPPAKAARIVDLVMLFREVGLEPGTKIAKLLTTLEPDVCAHVMTWMQGRFGKGGETPQRELPLLTTDLTSAPAVAAEPESERRLPRDIGRQPRSAAEF